MMGDSLGCHPDIYTVHDKLVFLSFLSVGGGDIVARGSGGSMVARSVCCRG